LKKHTRETIEPLRQAINSGLEFGDIEYACHAADYYCAHLFFNGEHLDHVQEQQKHYIDFADKFSQEHQFYLLKTIGQVVENLRGMTDNKLLLIGSILNKEEAISYLREVKNLICLFRVYYAKTVVCYLFKQYEEALKLARKGLKYSLYVQSNISFIEQNFYYCLILLAHFEAVSGEEEKKQEYLSQVE
jgi:predicted ATPase